MKIGWIGLGNMGVPMAKNLLKAGKKLNIYNRTMEKANGLIDMGAEYKNSPLKVTEESDIIFVMVSDDTATKEVFKGESGIIQGLKKDKIVVDMSTVSPNTSKELSNLVLEKGANMIDAPVSGSVKPAEEGNLVILAGGEEKTYQTLKPLFDILGKESFYLGTSGSGTSAKLAINSFLGITIQGLAETVLFAEKAGISNNVMLNIINESVLQSPITKLKTNNIVEDNYKAAFALKHGKKDLGLALDQIRELAIDLPLVEKTADTFEEAYNKGYGEQDIMAILPYLYKKRKKIELL